MDQVGVMSPQGQVGPGRIRIWLRASRAFTLAMPVMCVTVGSSLAFYTGASLSLPKYLAVIAAAVFLQIGANLINDYYDFIKGTDLDNWQAPDAYGPGLAIQQGLLTARQIHVVGLAAFATGAALGLTLVYACGWPVLMFGLAGALGSYFYTAEPLSLAYHGFGDFMVFVLMGPGYVMGSYYVQALGLSWAAALVGIPLGLLCSGVLQVNNLRDIENDRKHGKWTLAAIIGRKAALAELVTCDVLAYVMVLVGVLFGLIPWPSILVVATLPRVIDQVRLVSGEAGAEEHNRAMARSGQLQFEFGLVLVVAFVAGRFMGW